MLTELDDTLMHQSSLPFSFVASSDHRFFDRYWFEACSSDGNTMLICGMGRYANMNVLDGFITVQVSNGKQYNVRFSRELRPDLALTRVGGLEIIPIKPLESLHIIVHPGNYPVSCDLIWTGNLECFMEQPTVSRTTGRVASEACRFNQMGDVEGSLTIDGNTFEVENWWSVRDHSWGVRPGVGGFEPVTTQPDLSAGRFFLWFAFRVNDYGGYVQLFEDQDGIRTNLFGAIVWPKASGKEPLRVVDISHNLKFYYGTRAYSHADLVITTEDGSIWEVEAEPLMTAWAYSGTGYNNGYNDGQGLGAFRGKYVEETDIYDVSHPEIVRDMNGQEIPPGHREQPAMVTVNGSKGLAHLPVMITGPYHPYGL